MYKIEYVGVIQKLKEERQLYKMDNCLLEDDIPDEIIFAAFDEAIKALYFKEYFDELYGQGVEVLNWHQNGEPEPFDNFYNSAIEYSEWE